MTTALVTGSTGFCGTHLVPHLREHGLTVARIGRPTEHSGVEFVDLTNHASLAATLRRTQPAFVFHLAGVMNSVDVADFFRINALAAASLINALEAECPNAVLLLVGSAAEYGALSAEELPARETGAERPVTAYGVSKWAQTQLGLAAARRGMHVIVARPANIVGAGMPPYFALASFARQLASIQLGLKSPVIEVGNLESVRDLVDVGDVVGCYWKLVQRPAAYGKVVNVSSGIGVRMSDALRLLIALAGVPVEVRSDPSRQRAEDVSNFYASRDRLEELIGPQQALALEESLRTMLLHERSRLERAR